MHGVKDACLPLCFANVDITPRMAIVRECKNLMQTIIECINNNTGTFQSIPCLDQIIFIACYSVLEIYSDMIPIFCLATTQTSPQNSTTPGIDQDNKSQIVQGAIGTGVVLMMVVLSVGFMIRKKKILKRKDDSKNEESKNHIIIVVDELSIIIFVKFSIFKYSNL